MNDEKQLLVEVKSVLDAIDAIKTGIPTRKPEEVEVVMHNDGTTDKPSVTEPNPTKRSDGGEPVKLGQPTDSTDGDPTRNAAGLKVEGKLVGEGENVEAPNSPQESIPADAPATEPNDTVVEAARREETPVDGKIIPPNSSSADRAPEDEETKSVQTLDVVKQLAKIVGELANEVTTLKTARTAKKGVMPEDKSEEDTTETEEDKLRKQAKEIFG